MNQESVSALLGGEISSAMAVFKEKLDLAAHLEVLKRKEALEQNEVEALYGFKVATLATWRCRGGGPDFFKKGGVVLYPQKALVRFVEDRMVKGRG